MILAHRIQLDPTVKQANYFRRACGTARFVWNAALAEWARQYEAGGKPSGASLKKSFNATKYEQYPWLRDVHRDAHSQPFANLQKAFVNFFNGRSRRPKFKKKGVHEAFYVANDKFRANGRAIRLPLIGWVRMAETLRFTGKIVGAVVSCRAGRWFVSIQVNAGEYKKERTENGFVGVDLGVSTAATLSNGVKVSGPKPLQRHLIRLRRLSRQHSRKQKGSHRRAKAASRIAKLHHRIGNIRRDFLHKLTTRLCRENQAVAIEDLNVQGMVKNRRLSRAIHDIGFYEFRRQLTYKAEIYGTHLVCADRWFASSKTCNSCGEIREELTLADRLFRCEGCGHVEDRDVNAAKNLKHLCTVGLTETYARGPEGSGDAGSGNVKPCRDEAGTKPRQQ